MASRVATAWIMLVKRLSFSHWQILPEGLLRDLSRLFGKRANRKSPDADWAPLHKAWADQDQTTRAWYGRRPVANNDIHSIFVNMKLVLIASTMSFVVLYQFLK